MKDKIIMKMMNMIKKVKALVMRIMIESFLNLIQSF